MQLPVMPPVAPMLAKSAKKIPSGMHYEGKWDGFRSIIFRDGDEVEIGSRNERPMTRYFPEVVEAAREHLPPRCVVDGEIIIVTGDHLDFERLLDRIHPADSRVRELAERTPASFLAFDLLALGDVNSMEHPFEQRREALVGALADAGPPVHLAQATTDETEARRWFDQFEGAGLDGLIAKGLNDPYRPGERTLVKVKHDRTADCVVAGFRWHKSGGVVGSLLLGLYDDAGTLQFIGVSSAFPMKRRAELVEELAPYRMDAGALAEHPWADWARAEAHEGARLPGNQSRWNAGKDLSWEPLRPELVVEVAYDHMQGTRLRHTAQFRRWRTDRDPKSCTYEQLEEPVSYDIAQVLGTQPTSTE
ncbi:ATP-dependent DNA ligase [Actinobacteria bacterium YIM 96077]|uniref:DNA ligase (ATP) n=1 Tax=Phytoactinopolyspora halophila TaxID=1981511 RepID=A0A329QZD2_9ACTN|nr:ATP-dependent DNA ligase [Phytoactinopolyspora halophila]AYY15491.1 ATP-dependent DNA ligase [Actinobacteria bacterium YIM 96077]RAW17651.1 ATP-dependent DNA ligase [Phytoactinopolyspora halophila]